MDINIIRADRKTISLSVDDNLQAVVRAPYGMSDKQIREYVANNSSWLEQAVVRKKRQLQRFDISDEEKKKLKALAEEIIPKRVKYYSSLMCLVPESVKITSAKKRFGSCSGRNSLCFSFYLLSYPMEAVDYVVVHELAHIRHHNHGREFYALVEKYMPDYKQRERLLKAV